MLKKWGISLLLGLLLLTGCNTQNEDKAVGDRKLYTDVELGVNYITHIFTLGDIGFMDKDYVTKYGDYVSEEDLECLSNHKEQMSFLQHNSGDLVNEFYFIPAYNNFDTKEKWQAYFKALDDLCASKDARYMEPYAKGFDWQLGRYEYLKDMKDEDLKLVREVLAEIGKVFINNFDTYKDEIWPDVKPILESQAQAYNEMLKGQDYISAWEEVTDCSYGDNSYYIALYYAGRNGPSFNNVSLYKNTAYYNPDAQEHMIDMFSHELGIHVFMNDVRKVQARFYKDELPGDVIYIANETLATFYHSKILGKQGKDSLNLCDYGFYNIYKKLYEEGVTKPSKLMKQGMKRYIKQYPHKINK